MPSLPVGAPLSRAAAWAAGALFLLLLVATSLLLWNAHTMTLGQQLGAAAAIVAGLWLVGAVCTPRGEVMPAGRVSA